MKLFLILTLLVINFSLYSQDNSSTYSLGDRYALVIGVSTYQNPVNNLRYAQKDATDFHDALIKNGKFKKENIRLLVNKDASRENIRKSIEGWLKSSSKSNDLVIIFFSGHGSQVPDSDGDEDDGLDECLIPYDFDNEDYSSVITDDIFAYWVRNLASEKVLLIFDNCYSGGAAKQKGVSLSGVKGNIGKDDFIKDITREVPRKGTALLAASKADQVSFESSEFENGVFTHFLINSISAASDNDFNKIINSSELYYATRQKTLEFSRTNFKRDQEPIYLDMLKEEVDVFYLPLDKKVPDRNKDIEALKYKVTQEPDYKKKLILFKQVYDADPYSENTNSEIASLYEINKDYLRAIEHYKYVLSLNTSHSIYSPPISARIGDLYNIIGQKDLAITYYLQSIKTDSNDPDLYNNISSIYLSNKDTLSAIQNLNKSIDIQPLQKKPYLTLFYLHMYNRNFEIANQIISNSYRINSLDFETLYWHSLALKYFAKSPAGDSLFLYFEANSGIKNKWAEFTNDSKIRFSINGKILSQQESQLIRIQEAIQEFPYYDGFYKSYIQYVRDNNITKDISGYIKQYLSFSKYNPDTLFVEKYLK
jgi:tetratricopeptide (TPR) repeat protein